MEIASFEKFLVDKIKVGGKTGEWPAGGGGVGGCGCRSEPPLLCLCFLACCRWPLAALPPCGMQPVVSWRGVQPTRVVLHGSLRQRRMSWQLAHRGQRGQGQAEDHVVGLQRAAAQLVCAFLAPGRHLRLNEQEARRRAVTWQPSSRQAGRCSRLRLQQQPACLPHVSVQWRRQSRQLAMRKQQADVE